MWSVLLILCLHLVLTALPGVAAVLLAARLGLRSVPLLLAVGLAATGALAMLAFWAYYGNRQIGEAWSFFVLLGSIALVAWLLWERRIEAGLLRELALPLALWALASAFLVFFGFLHGGSGFDEAVPMASLRFSGQLPSDNDIPLFYSEWFFQQGHHGVPPIYPGGWHASDRPPLQIGYVLLQRPLGWQTGGLHYEVLGVMLQQLWVIGLWALLRAARIRRATVALVMLAVLVSDLTIVNGFFTWPKLLPAAMLLAVAALVLTPLWAQLRSDWRAGALVGLLLALAMMGHGSSIFGVIPLAAIAAYRGLPSWRWLGVALLVGALVTVPWSQYQKHGDPPGNRLTKWMLAGVTELDGPDPRGTKQAITDSYAEIGLGGAIHNKAENFAEMAGGGQMASYISDGWDSLGDGHFGDAAADVRVIGFFYLFPSLGLLLLAPLAMLFALGRGRGREPPEWSLALACFFVVGVGALTWGLILFGTEPARTSIHVGSLVIPLLAICGAVLGLRSVYPRLANWVAGTWIVLTLVVYTPALQPPPGSSYSLLAALFAAASLAGFCLLVRRPAL
jgi:hypothetical protein